LAAGSFKNLNETNVSYFINVDANTTNSPATAIMLGDRDLSWNGKQVSAGLFLLATNANVDWSRRLHPMGGCLAFADGHVELVRTQKMTQLVQKQPVATNHLLIP
jgi:hypothetical protein